MELAVYFSLAPLFVITDWVSLALQINQWRKYQNQAELFLIPKACIQPETIMQQEKDSLQTPSLDRNIVRVDIFTSNVIVRIVHLVIDNTFTFYFLFHF